MSDEGPLEKDEERAIIDLFARVGARAWKLSQGYRREKGGTRQTRGLADAYFTMPGRAFWFEAKSKKGFVLHKQLVALAAPKPEWIVGCGRHKAWKHAHEQEDFRRANEAAGVPSGLGDFGAAQAFLVRLGLARYGGLGFELTPMRRSA